MLSSNDKTTSSHRNGEGEVEQIESEWKTSNLGSQLGSVQGLCKRKIKITGEPEVDKTHPHRRKAARRAAEIDTRSKMLRKISVSFTTGIHN
jgi:hypothetical protein